MSTFPFQLTDLRKHFTALYPDSFVIHNDAAFWMQDKAKDKRLVILADAGNPVFGRFQGESSIFKNHTLKLCPLNHANARSLRSRLDWLKPKPIGLLTSAGMGDRLGSATPGHVRAMKSVGGPLVPIFAQQSIREMQRTNRSPDDVMTDATFGAFEGGWRKAVGADADHLKVPADIDACAAADYSFFTIDPGAHVDSTADTTPLDVIARQVLALPWQDLESSADDLGKAYVNRQFDLENCAITLKPEAVARAAVKNGRAIAHVAMMYRYLAAKNIPFEFEVSVDETETPTTHAEHIYVASELKRLGVKWVSLAPRYLGRFEKGVDYIGAVEAFEKDFAVHAQIARVLGPYKLSIHSGSDKFSVYPVTMRETRGLVHLKTAGTSYLEALRTIGALDSALFRRIYVFARARYETDKASYHVSAELEHAPKPESIQDDDLPALLDHFDAREILHVTFGSVLTTKKADGSFLFYDDFMSILRARPDAYAANLERHFVRHLTPFTQV